MIPWGNLNLVPTLNLIIMVSIENIIFLLLFICFLENFTEKDLWKESFHLIHNRYIIKLYHDERHQTMSWTTFITSPRLQSGDALLFYVSFSLLLFLFFHTFLSARFLGDALIKLHETLQEYHMPCEVVLLRVDFFQNGCRCHGNGQNAKKLKHKNDDSRLIAKQKLMKLDRNNIHI